MHIFSLTTPPPHLPFPVRVFCELVNAAVTHTPCDTTVTPLQQVLEAWAVILALLTGAKAVLSRVILIPLRAGLRYRYMMLYGQALLPF